MTRDEAIAAAYEINKHFIHIETETEGKVPIPLLLKQNDQHVVVTRLAEATASVMYQVTYGSDFRFFQLHKA
jgi:hypothetical protein